MTDVDPLSENGSSLDTYVYKLFFAQFLFAWLFYMTWNVRRATAGYSDQKGMVQALVHISFISPVIIHAFYKDGVWLHFSPLVGVIFPVLQISNDLMDSMYNMFFICRRIFTVIKVTVVAVGLQGFIEDQWERLRVPTVLRAFFITRVLYQALFFANSSYFEVLPPILDRFFDDYRSENITEIIQTLLVRSCETTISLLSATSIVAYIGHYIGLLIALCVGTDLEEGRNMGNVSGCLFLVFAVQNGLTGLTPEKRLLKIYKNFIVLSAAILHFIHSMINPILLSQNASKQKHARLLVMCVFLVVYPVWLVNYLWQQHSVSPWLLAVTAFSIEIVMKVVVTLTIYTLYIIDSYRDTFWEKLDDYVYYIQSTGNTLEFLFKIFTFFNAGWIMVFESWGLTRTLMMCVHAYFNIFVQAKEGWEVFNKRRTAVNKINTLREASAMELKNLEDVCAICYQELRSARVTRCNHYYHSVCLLKWLYIQDNCPMCSEVLHNRPEKKTSKINMDEANQNNIPNAEQLNGGQY